MNEICVNSFGDLHYSYGWPISESTDSTLSMNTFMIRHDTDHATMLNIVIVGEAVQVGHGMLHLRGWE